MAFIKYVYFQNGRYCIQQRGEADVPLYETIKTNAGTQPKNELQQ